MSSNELLTEKLTEKVYASNKYNGDAHMQQQLGDFISELYNRRRSDSNEEGLQAGMLIMPSSFAAKITENDGNDPHGITNINLLRYIKKEKDFYVREAAGKFGVIKNEMSEIFRNGIEIRIIDAEENLMMAIQSNSNIQTRFQLEVLKKIANELWRIKQNGLYESVEVGFYSPLSQIDVDDLNEELYSELIEAIKTEKISLEEKNKNLEKDEER